MTQDRADVGTEKGEEGHDKNLATKIVVGLLLGGLLGLVAQRFAPQGTAAGASLSWWLSEVVQPLGSIFLRLIFMVVIPLIFAAIVAGVAELGDLRRVGRVGVLSLLVTLLLSGTSVMIGVGAVSLVQPGKRIPQETRDLLMSQFAANSDVKTTVETGTKSGGSFFKSVVELIPKNPLSEAVHAFDSGYSGGGLMAWMVFSVFVGIAATGLSQEMRSDVLRACSVTFGICMAIIGYAMKIAPLAVACFGFVVTAKAGLSVIQALTLYILTVVGALALHLFGTYSLVLLGFRAKNPLHFFRQAKEAMITAFSTSSSNATLPVSLRVAEEELKVQPGVARFVLTVGATANQNGTALYEGVTVLFLAQLFGVDLTLTQQFSVALACVLAGVGTAGIPGGSLPLVVGVLASVGVQPESIAIILGIDRILDMCRTIVNVTGDLVIAVVVGKLEARAEAKDFARSVA